MSKMPAKKKSCFQITSVTQAQVAASSIPDDAESLDDPDESRTEDVSRADIGTCDMGSSEETLNNAGEPQEQPHTGPVNGGLTYNKSTGTGRVTPRNAGGSVPVSAAAHPAAPSSTTGTVPAVTVPHTAPVSASCSSRFRVIKLDHGTGEPFRRGRWTCTEFYDRDSDSNVSRTVDSIKPAVNQDHSIERDSGLGVTSSSIVTSSAFSIQVMDNLSDSGYSVSVGHPVHPPESLHKGYSLTPQIGSGASAFQPTGYTLSGSQKPQQAQVNMQPVASQTFLSNSHNGVHQGAIQQKSPVTQPQQLTYATYPTGVSPGHPDYHQHHFGSSSQNPPMTSLAAGPPAGQVPSPVMTPAAGPGGEAASAQALLHQAGNSPAVAPIHSGSVLQQPVSLTQLSGGLGISTSSSIITTITTTSHSGGQNVPATVPNSTSTPLGVPSQMLGTGGLIQLQGAHAGATASLIKQTDDGRQKSDALPQNSVSMVPLKDGVKPFLSEGLNLPTPAVNSLFGIHITMDVDEDRNPSTAFYQAFRPSRIRGSKPVTDSASGASVVAIDNKIEQAMDLVKSHLMYAVREEVEVLKEQIKELYERNSVLERENAVLKSLANSEQLNHLSSQLTPGNASPPPPPLHQQQQLQHPHAANAVAAPLAHQDGAQSAAPQPNITSA